VAAVVVAVQLQGLAALVVVDKAPQTRIVFTTRLLLVQQIQAAAVAAIVVTTIMALLAEPQAALDL
jgi:hypothetical protein